MSEALNSMAIRTVWYAFMVGKARYDLPPKDGM